MNSCTEEVGIDGGKKNLDVDGGREREEGGKEEERINQMDDVANLTFVTTKGSPGDTAIDLTM